RRDLVSGHARIGDSRNESVLGDGVAVANSASLNANSNLSRARLAHGTSHHLEVASGPRHLHRRHPCHGAPPSSALYAGREVGASPRSIRLSAGTTSLPGVFLRPARGGKGGRDLVAGVLR